MSAGWGCIAVMKKLSVTTPLGAMTVSAIKDLREMDSTVPVSHFYL